MLEDFFSLTPDVVLDSLEEVGFTPSGLCIQLNSYENRVFDIEVEADPRVPALASGSLPRVVAKFYRPGRWSRSAIQDEHQFLKDLKAEGIQVVAPLTDSSGSTLYSTGEILFALFPKAYGRIPQELTESEIRQVGRRLAQIHNLGALSRAPNRLNLSVEEFGYPAIEVLENWVWPELRERYLSAAEDILAELAPRLKDTDQLRIHGDCHRGNLLHNGYEFFFVDFDDFCNGPAVQDFWMLIGGESDEALPLREAFLEGYEELRSFNYDEWQLVPLLRGLRLIHYSAWIARRWQDPSFPKLFPDFNNYLYWLEECDSLDQIRFR